MYCLRCGEPICLLGLLDRKTGYDQYACSNCDTIYLKTNSGLIYPKDEQLSIDKENYEI